MRTVLLAIAAASVSVSTAWAGQSVGTGAPPTDGPCDAACQQDRERAAREAEQQMADAPGDWAATSSAPPKGGKKPGARGGQQPPPDRSSPSGVRHGMPAEATAQAPGSQDVDATNLDPAIKPAPMKPTIPEQRAQPPVPAPKG